jgi:DNA (cytosine-5)-methyltransferase 1
LERHWPNVPRYGDVSILNGGGLEWVDLIAGGFPCQDLSCAGKRAGIDGERSGLWSHFARLIGEVRPRFVLIENVPGLLGNEPMRRVLGDLSALRFDAEWRVLRASDVGAPHERQRVFIVAYSHEVYGTAGMGDLQNGKRPIFAASHPERSRFWVQASNLVARMGDGVSKEFYRPRGEAIGNAVVPQVAEWIGRRILEAEGQ